MPVRWRCASTERNDFSSNRHPASLLVEHDLFREPVSTPAFARAGLFRDHALMTGTDRAAGGKAQRLVAVTLDEGSIGRAGGDVGHERGPFTLHLRITGNRLMLDIRCADGAPAMVHLLSLSPLRRLVKDYFMVCDSYYEAIRNAPPERIEALDMGRRSLHDAGS